MPVEVEVVDHGGGHLELDGARLREAVERTCDGEELPDASLTVVLVDEARSGEIHARHFHDPEPTDVMSFPDGAHDPDGGQLHLGDVVICPPIAVAAVARRGGDVDAPAMVIDELILYVVHGLLHLLGFDDVEEADRAAMWDRQRGVLEPMGIHVGDP